MERKVITSERAPAAVGPCSQAIAAGNQVFCSGQLPIDPVSGAMVSGDIRAAADRVVRNLQAVLESAGLTDILTKSRGSSNPHNVVKATIDALENLMEVGTVSRKRGLPVMRIFNTTPKAKKAESTITS